CPLAGRPGRPWTARRASVRIGALATRRSSSSRSRLEAQRARTDSGWPGPTRGGAVRPHHARVEPAPRPHLLWSYTRALGREDLLPLALYSATALPLV